VLLTAAGLARMRPGSVVVDGAASELGGNVEGSRPGGTVVTPGGVTLIGAGNLASAVPRAASTAYARNVVALVAYLTGGGALAVDLDDEVQAGLVITHGGRVVHPAVRALLEVPA
jgi:NAD(P) transhydrogenase subunit alpha